MKNDPDEPYLPSGGYRGVITAQPPQASNTFQAGFPGSYDPFAEGGYQQPEQLSDTQQCYGYQPREFVPLVEQASLYARVSPSARPSRVGWLSYLGGWVTGLLFLLLKREDRFVRFHALQSLIFFGGMSIVMAIFSALPLFSSIATGLGFVAFICWLVLMVKAARGRYYKLPVIGDYADKWANSLRD